MRYGSVTDRLADLGGEKWEVHALARKMKSRGQAIIELTIGEPDVATPVTLMDVAIESMKNGRTGYSDGRGEANLLEALAGRYSDSLGRAVGSDQILCFPGTQTALYAVVMGLCDPGDEILVGDPMYATYEGVIAASGAMPIAVPLKPDAGFRISAEDIGARITPRSRAILLNTPHNPTGSILTAKNIAEICALALRHDLWIISDEVYDELIFDGETFVSPLIDAKYSDRVIVVSSISKSHAAPGFRSGWCVGPAEFTKRLLPLSETILFGNQPFIADMTATAVSAPSLVAPDMRVRFARRARGLQQMLDGVSGLAVHPPQAGMFALINIASTGLTSRDYALNLLENTGVAVMPGSSFGEALRDWVRIALTVEDSDLIEAAERIADHASALREFKAVS